MVSTQRGEITVSVSIDHVDPIHIPPTPRGNDSDDESLTMTAKKAGKDILFGSIAGMVSEIFEYPFDLAKVRLQSQLLSPSPSSGNSNPLRFNGPMDCLTQTWKEEGLRGLYRGLPAPIVGSMAETASLFVAYAAFQNVIRSFTSPSYTYDTLSPPPPLSISQLAVAAGGAGFVTSFVLTPIELIKCKMQVQMMNFHPTQPPSPAPGRIPRRSSPNLISSIPLTHGSTHTSTTTPCTSAQHQHQSQHTTGRMPMHDLAFKASSPALLCSSVSSASAITATRTLRPPGPIALIRSVVDKYGVRGLWLGHTGTLLRETGGTASWFVVKEWFARVLVERRIRQLESLYLVPPDPGLGSSGRIRAEDTELRAWESAVSGALAGAVGALLFYPADTVKSAIQTEEELRPKGSFSRTQSTFLGTFRRMWTTHGLKGLYAGCGMTVARAVPSSGIIFVVYDGLTAYFS